MDADVGSGDPAGLVGAGPCSIPRVRRWGYGRLAIPAGATAGFTDTRPWATAMGYGGMGYGGMGYGGMGYGGMGYGGMGYGGMGYGGMGYYGFGYGNPGFYTPGLMNPLFGVGMTPLGAQSYLYETRVLGRRSRR